MWKVVVSGLRVISLLAGFAVLVAPHALALVGDGDHAPEIVGQAWVNSDPLSMQALRGRVVLIDFWTYG